MPWKPVRRAPLAQAATVLVAASLLAGCGGEGAQEPSGTAPVADAPATTAPPAHRVVISIDGEKTETMTTGTTVREVLTEAGITLGQHDLVKPAADEPAGELVKIARILSKPKLATIKSPLKTVRKNDSSVAPWSEKVVREGQTGITIVRWAYVPRKDKNGKTRKVRKALAKKVKRKPVTRVIAVGPKSASAGSAANLNWSGLARCESTNNPKAVNPAGYYGLYQFSLPTWQSVGGTGRPSDASPGEQTYRAQLLYNKVNGRWQGQWPQCGKFLFS